MSVTDEITHEPDSDTSPDVAVRLSGVTVRYGDLFAVKDMNLDIPRGSTFGLIGPNGAGKSTTFLAVASLLKPTSGTVEVAGCDTVSNPRGVRAKLGYMPDVMGVYDDLRVEEYLHFFAAAYRVPRSTWKTLVDGLLELVNLDVKRDAMVDSLSRGMKQRLSLARALVHDPEVLVLDEPASGLDPRARVELRDLIGELRNMGKTIIVSSHILSELEEMCTEVAIMEAGQVLATGTPRDIGDRLGQGREIGVRLVGGEVQTFTVASEEEQRDLLIRLVNEGVPVVEFTETSSGLEELFLRVTKGIVQ